MNEKENNEYEVVSGDGSNLNISPVYEHLNTSRPRCADGKLKNVVIPKATKNKNKDKKDDDSDSKNENKDSE